MAILQIKGTKQEIIKMLEVFNGAAVDFLYEVEFHVEEQDEQSSKIQITSTNSCFDTCETDEADRFVVAMLTGVYND